MPRTIVLVLCFFAGACGGDDSDTDTDTDADTDTDSDTDSVDTGDLRMVMVTSMGTMEIDLFEDEAPITSQNFVDYAEAGFYDGGDDSGATIFHRVMSTFMIQGGGLTADLTKKLTNDPIVNESAHGLNNFRGTISMARLNDPDSATSQFFINVVDNLGLDYVDEANPGYAVFGAVTDGFEVMDAIKVVPTETRGAYQNVPVDTITITEVRILR